MKIKVSVPFWGGFSKLLDKKPAAAYNISLKSSTYLHYAAGGYEADIGMEILASGYYCVIYLSSVKTWLPPHEDEHLTEQDRRKIEGEVSRYFKANNKTYIID